MQKTSVPNLSRDPRLMMVFLTIIVTGMYVMTVVTVPEVRRPLVLAVFTLLIIVHLVLHWLLEKITTQPKWIHHGLR